MSDQKTEKATPRRLLKAREEGNFATARVFVSAVQFITFVTLLHNYGASWGQRLKENFTGILEHDMNPRLAAGDIVHSGTGFLIQTLTPVSIMWGALLVITLAFQLGVTGFGVSFAKLQPDLKRLDPFSRLKQLPGQNFPALLQAAVMIPVFGAAVYYLVADNLDKYMALPLRGLAAGAMEVLSSIESLLWKAAGLFLVFGLVDLVRQQSRYRGQLKMTKQEIRDESKDIDGNPVIKNRVRRLRRDLARRRMMHEIPTATAVIVNPTHYAVVLKYSVDAKGAPKVVAKGKNYLALRIRQKAIECGVPLIENPPLAQGLYKSVDIGQEIPAHFYRAVAEVLAYIFRIMNGRQSA